jgi:predicted transcriptional regulator
MTVPQADPSIAFVEIDATDLTRVFLRVNNFVSEDQELLWVSPETSVLQALALMKENNYSQIPVKAGTNVLGIFSYRSFATQITEYIGEKFDPNQLRVVDFTENIEFVHVSEDLSKTLDTLYKKDAILVGNPDDLKALLTPIDLVRGLYKLSSPFVLIKEIEGGIRNIIRNSMTPDQLRTIIQQCLSQIYREENMPKLLEEMSFNDYVQVVGDGRSWTYFQVAFGAGDWQRKRTRAKLEVIRDLRNDIFHFKRNILESDISILVAHRDWIKKVVTAFQAGKVER